KPEQEAEAVFQLLQECKQVARHRRFRHLIEAPGEDKQFFRLQDAIASFGVSSFDYVKTWWRACLEDDDPHRSFVLAYTWASWAHPDALHHLLGELTLLPETAREDAHLAG